MDLKNIPYSFPGKDLGDRGQFLSNENKEIFSMKES